MKDQLLNRITIDPKIMVGKPIIRGTRIPVELILKMLAQGIPEEEILQGYPRLQLQDIHAALHYATQIVAQEDVFPIPVSPEAVHA